MGDQQTISGRGQRPAVTAQPPTFFSVAEVAGMFGISAMTIYRAISAGQFPAIRVRGRLFVPARAVDAMVDAAIAEQTVVDAAGWVPERVTR